MKSVHNEAAAVMTMVRPQLLRCVYVFRAVFFLCPVIKNPPSDGVLEGAITDRQTDRKCKSTEGGMSSKREGIILQAQLVIS